MNPDPWLIVCDLDGTLLGADAALIEFRDWYRRARHIRLAYATGRSLQGVRESLAETALPVPDFAITNIGTEIREMPSGTPLLQWPLVQGKNWNRSRIVEVLRAFPELTLQPDEFQSPWKASYFLSDNSPETTELFVRNLTAQSLEFEMIASGGRFLDFLPPNSHKGAAVEALAKHLRVANEQVIVAGDSGNDSSMFAKGFRSIIVGNAQPELKSVQFPRAYQASASFAAGVLEGLDFWGTAAAEGS